MSLREEIKESLIESRNVILNGGVNCIPSELSRFRSEFPGVRKKFYYVVTGGTKSGKTQFTNFMFVITHCGWFRFCFGDWRYKTTKR